MADQATEQANLDYLQTSLGPGAKLANPTNPGLKPTSPVVLSSAQGMDSVQKDQNRLASISANPLDPAKYPMGTGTGNGVTGKDTTKTGTETQTKTSTGKIKYINLDGQTQELSGDNINPETVQSLLDQGYYSAESSGDVPSWATTGDLATGRQQAQANAALKTAQSDLDALKTQLAKFTITDAQLKAQTDAIGGLWDKRISDMERINTQREQSIKTLGIRLGNRYTGGEGGMFGGIIAEEERQGVSRIADLEAEKQAAISAAEGAARDKNWQVYSKEVDNAEARYKDKLDAVKELNKMVAANNNKIAEENRVESKKIQEQVRQASRDNAVSGLLAQGITDPNLMLNYLNYDQSGNAVGDFTAKEVSDTMKSLSLADKAAPGIVGEWLAAKENDPSLKNVSLMDYIQQKDPESALDIQQQELQIKKLQKELNEVGSDEDPSQVLAYAQQYAVTGVIPTGLPKGTFNVVSQMAKEIPKANGVIVNAITGVADSKAPATEQADYAKLYNILSNVKRLRELDAKRASMGAGGLVGGLLGMVLPATANVEDAFMKTRKAIVDDMSRMQSGAALTPAEIENYEEYLPGRFSDTPGTGNLVGQNSLQSINNFETIINNRLRERLETNGLSMYGYSKVKIGSKEYSVGDVVTNSQGQTGRVLPDGSIATEGESPQTFNSVGNTSASTDLQKGIVAGYDIKSYATDPSHEKRISSIYNTISSAVKNSVASIDSYIRRVASNSPIKGVYVAEAASKYNVDPKMILAIMQQDSTFGTQGKAVRTKNPGNVGNDDSGRTVDMGTWQNGVMAVAKNLSKRKRA